MCCTSERTRDRMICLWVVGACVLGATSSASAFDLYSSRWSYSIPSGSVGSTPGTPMVLTWGLAAEGTYISASEPGESTDGSSLIAAMDAWLGTGPGGSDLTQRPWYGLFSQSYDRLAGVSGVGFLYEPNDVGWPMPNAVARANELAELRIGAHAVDGSNGEIAYAYYPSNGDMVIDTASLAPGGFLRNSTNDYRFFRNIFMHETLHALGVRHVNSTENFLMGPTTAGLASIDGPQFDDILALHRWYGDAREKDNNYQGNGTALLASTLGTLSQAQPISLGTDGASISIAPDEADFLSISGQADTDVFAFDVEAAGYLTGVLSPKGPAYLAGPEGGSQTTFDAAAQNDLLIEILDTDGETSLGLFDAAGLGASEAFSNIMLDEAGTYYARIAGSADAVQMYQFDLAFITEVPEPTAMSTLLLAGGWLLRKRRRNLSTDPS